MKKKLYFRKKKKAALVSLSQSRKISFFEETPSEGHFCGDGVGHTNVDLRAHDLFSIFTGDIIREETIFIR